MFWNVLLFIGFTILSELLRPKPKIDAPQPSSIGDFQLPTADEARAIPVVWGTCDIRGPNVVSYGNLQIIPITESVKTGLFSKQTVIRGYNYYLTIHCVLCHGPLGVSGSEGLVDATSFEVRFDERAPLQTFDQTGSHTTPNVRAFGQTVALPDDRPERQDIFCNDLMLFGGPDKEGGIQVGCHLYAGGVWNGPSPLLQAYLGTDIPSYRGVAHAVISGYVGTSPYVKPISFIVQRCPSPKLFLDGDTATDPNAVIGTDANPAYIILEILTDTLWGLAIPRALIDVDSFYQVAGTLSGEGLGMSYMIDNPAQASEVIGDVLRHIDGVMYTDPATGLITLSLARQDYDIEAIPVFDKSNLKSCDMTRGSLSETKNSIKVIYIDGSIFEQLDDTILLVHFNGSEGQTTATDETGNIPSGDIDFNGNAHIDADHTLLGGQTLYLDGSSDSVLISTHEPVQTFWGPGDLFTLDILFENDGPMPELVSDIIGFVTNTDQIGLVCYLTRTDHPTAANRLIMEWKTSPGVGTSLSVPHIVDGGEHWMRFSHDGTTARLSFDGVEEGSSVQPLSNSFVTSIIIGKNPITIQNNGFFKGWIKEVRITAPRARDSNYELPVSQFNYPEVNLIGRGAFREKPVQQQNLANIQSRGGVLAQERIPFLGLSNAVNANKVAARVLKTLSYPLATFKMVANRDAWQLRPGSVFTLNWEPLGISDMAVRVMRIGYGDLTDGRIEIDAAEDVFGMAATAFTPPSSTEWVDEIAAPEPAFAELLIEMPYHFISANDRYVVSLAVRDSLLDTGYNIWSDRAGDTDPEFLLTASSQAFTPSGLLVAEYDHCTDALDATGFQIEDGTDLSVLESVTTTQRDAGVNLAMISSINGNEFIAWQTVANNSGGTSGDFTNIVRGVLDTVPLTHPAGSRVWFYTNGHGVLDEDDYPDDRLILAKLLPFNGTGTLAIAAADQLEITLASRAARPYPPGNVLVNGIACPLELIEEDAILTWSHRHRVLQTDADEIVHQDAGDYSGSPEGDYIVEVYVGGTLHHTFQDFALSSDGYQVEYTFAQRQIDDSDMNLPVTFIIKPINDDDLEGTAREITFLMSFEEEEGDEMTFEARLTLETGVPVSTSDQTGKTTVYLTPYKGNRIRLYNGSSWVTHNLSSEISIAVPATTSQMYDLFVYDSAGLTLEAVAWTDDTNRATALAVQDGIYVKTGTLTKRYVGSFRTTGVSGQTEDSRAKRFLWNYYNRVARKMQAALETADTWTYTTATYRQANANAANQLDFIIGVSEDAVHARLLAMARNSTTTIDRLAAIGLDSTTTAVSDLLHNNGQPAANVVHPHIAEWTGYPGIGRHFLAWLEYSTATGTCTWGGDQGSPTLVQSGISGSMFG